MVNEKLLWDNNYMTILDRQVGVGPGIIPEVVSFTGELGYEMAVPCAVFDISGHLPLFPDVAHALRLQFLKDPTDKHFDPMMADLTICDPYTLAPLRLSHQVPIIGGKQIAPGLFTVRDRSDRVVQFYTFGASLGIEPLGVNGRAATLRSEAPIILISESDASRNWNDHPRQKGITMLRDTVTDWRATLAKYAGKAVTKGIHNFNLLLSQVPPNALFGEFLELMGGHQTGRRIASTNPDQYSLHGQQIKARESYLKSAYENYSVANCNLPRFYLTDLLPD